MQEPTARKGPKFEFWADDYGQFESKEYFITRDGNVIDQSFPEFLWHLTDRDLKDYLMLCDAMSCA